MRSATSFFNRAIARSDLRRYWPALFLYTAIWTILMPVRLWNRYVYCDSDTMEVTRLCSGTYTAAVILALCFGGIMAMAVFSYLMNARSVGAMHALPQRRGTLFWTHFLTGWGMLAAGNAFITVLTGLVALLIGVPLTAALLTWFAMATLLDLFFMALGTFCAMITGWLLAVPVLYAAANSLALIVTWLGQLLAGLLLQGFSAPASLPGLTGWLTPVYRLIADLGQTGWIVYAASDRENASYTWGLAPEGWRALLVYTAAGLVLMALARVLYARRRSELSGDAAAFRWMRPVFRLGVGLLGGLALGLGLYAVVFSHGEGHWMVWLAVCMVLMGAMCYLAASMLVGKTLRVFRRGWKGAAVTALALVLLCVGLRVDLFGYSRRIPQADQVVRAEGAGLGVSFQTESPEGIRVLLDMHRAAVDAAVPNTEIRDGGSYAYYRLTYTLTGGRTMSREIHMRRTEAVEKAMEAVAGLEEAQVAAMFSGDTAREDARPLGGYLYCGESGEDMELDAEKAAALYDAAWRDIRAGHALAVEQETQILPVNIYFQSNGWNCSIDMLRAGCTEVIQALRELGLTDQQIFGETYTVMARE